MNKRGIFNKYYNGMPFSERLTKDIKHFFRLSYLFFRSGFNIKTILIYPHYPSKKATISRICKKLGYNYTNNPLSKYKLAINWEYATYRKSNKVLEDIAKQKKVLNLKSLDINKLLVDAVFKEVFGYGTEINPLTFEGKAVKKSVINALHNYEIIDCPIAEKEEGFIYQILIDNNTPEGQILDFRLALINQKIPYVLKKYHPKGSRFKNVVDNIETRTAEEVFSSEEIKKFLEFSAKINIDYGELDVLRCNKTQKIYIIDVNNTPNITYDKNYKQNVMSALNKLACEFKNLVDNK